LSIMALQELSLSQIMINIFEARVQWYNFFNL